MPATTVLSLRLPAERAESLKRLARRFDRSTAETAARLLDEGLRREDFAMIEFRDSPVGRQAYVEGTRVAVWQVVHLQRAYDDDIEKTAKHLTWPISKVRAALNYAAAFPEETQTALEDGKAYDFTRLSRLVPALERIEVPANVIRGK
jgi:uncharacterized protein (DUF433 family)